MSRDANKHSQDTTEDLPFQRGYIQWDPMLYRSAIVNRKYSCLYFKLSKIYQQTHFVSHMTRNRFEELFRMLDPDNNHRIPPHLGSVSKFKAKIGKQLKNVCANSATYFHRQRTHYWWNNGEVLWTKCSQADIPGKPHEYVVKVCSICGFCCGYSLIQNLYLGGSVIPEGGRDIILELAYPYYDKHYVIYCDKFFTHLGWQHIYVLKVQAS